MCGERERGLITTAMGVSLFSHIRFFSPPVTKMTARHLHHMIKHSSLPLRPEAEPTLSLQQRWVQQLHHVLNLRIQLRHVTLSHDVRQHGQEVIGAIHPAWKEVNGETGRCDAHTSLTEAAEDETNAAKLVLATHLSYPA